MSLEKHYRWLMIGGSITIVLAVASYHYGDDAAPLIVVITIAGMALASWAKSNS
jgi:uncharacterized membrane protein